MQDVINHLMGSIERLSDYEEEVDIDAEVEEPAAAGLGRERR